MTEKEKATYWKNRKAGERGQGKKPLLSKVFRLKDARDDVTYNVSNFRLNRKNRRAKQKNRLYNKKGFRRAVEIKG